MGNLSEIQIKLYTVQLLVFMAYLKKTSNTPPLLEIESEIPIYRTRRRCFIRPYEFAFSFVYGNFPSRISVYKWKFSSQICKSILQDLNS
jgi:hypothetical protein